MDQHVYTSYYCENTSFCNRYTSKRKRGTHTTTNTHKLTLVSRTRCVPGIYVPGTYIYQRIFFGTFACFSQAPRGSFSRSRLWGTQGGRLYNTAQVWVPGGLRGERFGRSTSRNLASNRGVAFREARAEQDNGKPTYQLLCSSVVKGSNAVTTIASSFPRSYSYRHYYACVVMMYACMCCVCAPCTCVCVFTAGLSTCDACKHSVVACWEGHVHVNIFSSPYLYLNLLFGGRQCKTLTIYPRSLAGQKGITG